MEYWSEYVPDILCLNAIGIRTLYEGDRRLQCC